MADNVPVSEPLPSRAPTGLFRRFLLPVIVITAIIAAIWWIESRNDGAVSPTGERYGPVELPAALLLARN